MNNRLDPPSVGEIISLVERHSLNDLFAFLAIAEARNFRRAAVSLQVSPSALSHRMRALEARLGVRLLNRTTRIVTLTDAGSRLVSRLRPALSEVEDAVGELRNVGETTTGRLRLTTMEYGATLLIERRLAAFQERHPGIEIELVVDAALVDLVAGGFDAGVRWRNQVPSDMAVLALTPSASLVAAAAPAYLAERPVPARPGDLLEHRCIRQRLAGGGIYRWEFEEGGRAVTIDPPGALTINSLMAIVAAAIEGVGICYVPAHHVARPIADGTLVPLLQTFSPTFDGHCLYYPRLRQQTRAMDAFLRHLRADTGG